MKKSYLYVLTILLGSILLSGCRQELRGNLGMEDLPQPTESNSVVTMQGNLKDGLLRIAVDADFENRKGVWIDLDGDGKRSTEGVEDVKVFGSYADYRVTSGVRKINLHGDITSLQGASNGLTEIVVSGNPNLRVLNLPSNQLRSIDLSSNPQLERLDVSGNQLSEINLSANSRLVSLWCFNNQLEKIDLSPCPNLVVLDCSGNGLTTLDVKAQTKLSSLMAYNNRLSSIDVSQNLVVNKLWLYGNRLSETEIHRVIRDLKKSINGDLWLSVEPLPNDLRMVALEKGWKLD